MTDSIQKVLTRLRAPRVKILYEVFTGDAIEQKELPFVIGVISDLAGETPLKPFSERKFTYVDPGNFMDIIEDINPTLKLSVDNTMTENEKDRLAVELSFKHMDDFSPANIIEQVPDLKKVLVQRGNLLDLTAKLDGNEDLDTVLRKILSDEDGLRALFSAEEIDPAKAGEIVDQAKMIKNEDNRGKAIELLSAFAKLFTENVEADDLYTLLNANIAMLDDKLSKQIDQILHEPAFQKLEGRWRGLLYLISNLEISSSLKVRLLCATRDDIEADVVKAIEFDQSLLFKKVYEEEFGTFGGHPYSCLVADFMSFGRNAPDVQVLKKLTAIAAAAHATLLGGVNPELFDLEDFSQLPTPRDLANIFESSELAAWNGFRMIEDSRYASLFLPRILMRLPYGPNTAPVKAFNYTEEVNGKTNNKFCWGNPAYAMAVKIGQAFAKYHWTAAIRGVEGGGLVEGLPAYTFKTSEGDTLLKCPTEIAITDRREKELSDLGFISICHAKGTDFAAFFGGQTVQKPKEYNTAEATANAALSARLPYMLNCSRFAHYIKMMMRDKIGSLLSKADIQQYLQKWISQYVLLSDTAPQELKAKFPLREAKVDVVDDPRNPGSYKAVLFLRPHFQLEELTVSLRLVATLPSA